MIKFTEKREALKHIIGSYIYIDRVDFYKIIYDNDLILDMKTEASIQNGDEVLDGGRFIEPEIIGIIKKRSGICKRENRVAFAYKMKYEVIKRRAGRRKCGQVDHILGKKSIELIGEE